ncbi:MAG: hypothetical protein H0V12_00140 [Chloroflexi bacterium]|nr:hypothetical protein [Chloroflexota bacterium]
MDLPSGLDATTGHISTSCIRATATLTLALPKVGLWKQGVHDVTGELYLGTSPCRARCTPGSASSPDRSSQRTTSCASADNRNSRDAARSGASAMLVRATGSMAGVQPITAPCFAEVSTGVDTYGWAPQGVGPPGRSTPAPISATRPAAGPTTAAQVGLYTIHQTAVRTQ